jgi:hypothetical protein
MVQTLKLILEGVLDRLNQHIITFLPPLFAALLLFLGFYLAALGARWLLCRIFKGLAADRFLRQSGVAFLLDSGGRLRASRLVSEGVYWSLMLLGVLSGLSVFNTNITTKIIERFVFMLPRLAIAAMILLAGAWLAQFLGRSVLVWAVNESIPWPRRLGAVVRILVVFVAVVVAADELDFARSVFLSAFVLLVGGAMLAAGLAAGIAGGRRLDRYLERRQEDSALSGGRSLWNHL